MQSFQDWLYGDVLESIYDTGGYQVDGSKPRSSHDELMQMALQTQQKVVAMLQQNGQQIDHVQKEMTETRREVSEVQKRVDELDELILGQDVKEQRRIAFDTYRGENAPEMRNTINRLARKAAETHEGLDYSNVYTMLYEHVVKPVYGFDVYRKEKGSGSWLKACTVEELMLVRDAVGWPGSQRLRMRQPSAKRFNLSTTSSVS